MSISAEKHKRDQQSLRDSSAVCCSNEPPVREENQTQSLPLSLRSLRWCAKALNPPAGCSAGVPPEHGACHEMDVQGDFKQKAMGTSGAICPPVYLQMKTAETGELPVCWAAQRTSQRPQCTLATALAGVHTHACLMFTPLLTVDQNTIWYLTEMCDLNIWHSRKAEW